MNTQRDKLKDAWEKWGDLKEQEQRIKMELIDHQVNTVVLLVEAGAYDLLTVNWSRLRRMTYNR